MVGNEKEKKEKEKGPVEEKRVKATVIRRRQTVVVSPEPAPEAKAPAESPAKEAAAETTATEKEVKKRRGRPRKEQPEKKEALPEAPEAPVAAAPAPPEMPGAPAEAPKEEAKPVVVEKKGPEKARKEVKVFEKEVELKKFFTRPAKKGRRFRPERKAAAPLRLVKKGEAAAVPATKAAKKVIKIAEVISVADLSQRLGVKASELIKKLMGLGVMATVNQLIDIDAATIIAQDYGYGVENVGFQEEALMEEEKVAGKLEPRAPVVTVMGHVDHGKTSLLDAIRKTNVVGGEAGGITQHIGAYDVHLEKGDVTFLDTPGHEAFTAMRARGAKATDIVILVVAADDGVMPQTIEAINHAKAAGVPIIVAINKVDLPQADPSRIKNELMKYNLLSEEWGGETIFVEVSAKKEIHIKELLEMILLQAEMLELKASREAPGRGVVIEAKLDKGRGPVSTVLIQNGTLRVGDPVVAGFHHGRVRAMITDRGKRIEEAGPSLPVEILGLSGVPQAGDTFIVAKDEVTARQIATIRERKAIERDRVKVAKVSLSDLYEKIQKGEAKELNAIVKADVQGSIEAVKEALGKLSTEAIKIKFIHSAVGGINESDVMLASASSAIIIGFNVRPDSKAQALSEKENVDIRLYNIIYDLVDDVKGAMEGLLAPIVREEVLGRVEIRDVFRISKVGPVAGCYVTEGKVQRGARARLIRDNVVVYDGRINSLKRFKEDVREVAAGYECGLTIEGYNDIKAGDIVEPYVHREEAARL